MWSQTEFLIFFFFFFFFFFLTGKQDGRERPSLALGFLFLLLPQVEPCHNLFSLSQMVRRCLSFPFLSLSTSYCFSSPLNAHTQRLKRLSVEKRADGPVGDAFLPRNRTRAHTSVFLNPFDLYQTRLRDQERQQQQQSQERQSTAVERIKLKGVNLGACCLMVRKKKRGIEESFVCCCIVSSS